jgi:hypothetical protein
LSVTLCSVTRLEFTGVAVEGVVVPYSTCESLDLSVDQVMVAADADRPLTATFEIAGGMRTHLTFFGGDGR